MSIGAPTVRYILHLSDLHFGTDTSPANAFNQLAEDLNRELNCHRLDALIVSGDVSNTAIKTEYDAARMFMQRVCEEFDVPAEHIAIVPGNHDLNWELSEDSYTPVKRKQYEGKLEGRRFFEESKSVIQVCDERAYLERFSAFSQFYSEVTGQSYPLNVNRQGIFYHIKELDLLILGLNSAYELDHHFKVPASICPDAVAKVLTTIRGNPAYADCRKFAVWHHPLNGPDEDRIKDHGFLEQLAKAGFCVCLHGHIHKSKADQYQYDVTEDGRQIKIVGAGTFGAPVKEWTPGYPLQYNLLKLSGNTLTVETRCRRELNGAWEADAIWRQGKSKDPSPRYSIKLPPVEKSTIDPEQGNEDISPEQAIPDSASDLTADIQAYCHNAESLYEKLPLVGFRTRLRVPICIEDIYVPLRAMLDRRAIGRACFANAEDAENCLKHVAGECDDIAMPEAFAHTKTMGRPGIVILGDPGSGKTTHLKRMLLWCLRQGPQSLRLPAGMIPVFLPLRELRDLDQGLEAFIQAQLDKPHLNTRAGFGERLVERGNLLFLLDGLDEVADADQRARVARWIDEAVRVHRNCRFVVTCRFAGYTDAARLSEEFLEMHVRPLSFEQVKAFVGNWYRIVETGLNSNAHQAAVVAEEKAADLIARLDQPEFRARRVFELTRNPLLLTNICLVHRDRGNLPHSRDRLYEECTDVLLELWRASIGYQTRIDARSGRKVLQPAALWMHQEEGRTRASAAELAPVIDPAIKNSGWPHGNAEEFLRTVRDESGLLTGWDQDQYGFMHLGFQEYLAAREIQNTAMRDPSILADLARRFGQSWWQEVTLLLLALDNPCLFEPFMRVLVRGPGFTQYPELIEMCLDDAAEKPVGPFLELLREDPGEDTDLWLRQLDAVKLVVRLDNGALGDLIGQLANHPSDKVREWVKQRSDQESQKVVCAPRGGYALVRIPGGQFNMGSPASEKDRLKYEGPQHEVRTKEFYMGRYPVTNEEYGRFLAENPKHPEPKHWADRQFNQPRQPVVGVSWEDAQAYARWAGLNLPSEAQWEYACRAGSTTRYHSGDEESDLDRVGWYSKNSDDKLHPVGEREPNAFGLHDMHGNVDEWIEDDWHGDYENAPDDGNAWIGDPRGPCRVIRGGCWGDPARRCRSASRSRFGPGLRNDDLGFRLVLLPGQPGGPAGAESGGTAAMAGRAAAGTPSAGPRDGAGLKRIIRRLLGS